MSVLRSYSYNEELTTEIISLFSEAETLGVKLDYSIEIIDAALEGRIDLSKPFSLEKYISGIKKRDKLSGWHEARKNLHFINYENMTDTDDSVEAYGVPLSILVDERDEYQNFEDAEELRWAVSQIRELNRKAIVMYDIDLPYSIGQAIKGIPDAIRAIEGVCKEDAEISEVVEIVLGSGHPFGELFPDMV